MKFECEKCGNCCKEIREKYRGGIIGLCIFQDELDRLKKKAVELNKKLKLIPGMMIPDAHSKQLLILSYTIAHDDCPFYDDGCLIYEDRPRICRAFPVPAGISESKFIFSTKCLTLETIQILKKIKRIRQNQKKIFRKMYYTFGDYLLYELMIEGYHEKIKKVLNKLEDEGKMGHKRYTPTKDELKTWNKVDVEDFLKQFNIEIKFQKLEELRKEFVAWLDND